MFSVILKQLRLESGLSQAELGKQIGVSQGTIYFWEKGVNEPTSSYVVALARFFNISLEELLGVDPTPTPQNNDFMHVMSSLNKMNARDRALAIKLIDAIAENH